MHDHFTPLRQVNIARYFLINLNGLKNLNCKNDGLSYPLISIIIMKELMLRSLLSEIEDSTKSNAFAIEKYAVRY